MNLREVSLYAGRFERTIFTKALISAIIIEFVNFGLHLVNKSPWYVSLIPLVVVGLFLIIYFRFKDEKMPAIAIILSATGLGTVLVASYALNGGIYGSATYPSFAALFIILLIINPRLRNGVMITFLGLIGLLIILEMLEIIKPYDLPKKGMLEHSNFILVCIFTGYMIHSIKSFFDAERAELIDMNRNLKAKQFLINDHYENLERQKHELQLINSDLDSMIESRTKDLEYRTHFIREYMIQNSKEIEAIVPGVNDCIFSLEKGSQGVDEKILIQVRASFQLFERSLSRIKDLP